MVRTKFESQEERRLAKNKRERRYYEKDKTKRKKYYLSHKKEKSLKHKEYYEAHKEKILSKVKEYYQNHKKERNEYIKNKKNTDINFKLSCDLRSRLIRTIKNNQKAGSAVRDLGCSIPELKTYLESKFQEGMSWKNWSHTGWHIDHIIPLDSFDLTNREEFLKACHYTNLQPLWAKENIKKKNNR